MPNWTAADLATHVLRGLGILGTGQAAEADDSAVVTDAWTGEYHELRRLGLAPWAETAIQEQAQQGLRYYMQGIVGEHFGFPAQMCDRWRNLGISKLRVVVSGDKMPMPVRPEFF